MRHFPDANRTALRQPLPHPKTCGLAIFGGPHASSGPDARTQVVRLLGLKRPNLRRGARQLPAADAFGLVAGQDAEGGQAV